LRLLKIFSEAFDYMFEAFKKNEALIKITRLFEDIFREMKTIITGFFKDFEEILNVI
jgi:hypothetical protein